MTKFEQAFLDFVKGISHPGHAPMQNALLQGAKSVLDKVDPKDRPKEIVEAIETAEDQLFPSQAYCRKRIT